MVNFTIKNMSDLLYDRLSKIKYFNDKETETTLNNPTTTSIFPCRLIHTPLEYIEKTKQAIPLRKRFQVTIEHWASKQRELMEMSNNTDLELQKLNFVKTTPSPILYDDITKKYRLSNTYEVKYNAIFNTFEFIR